MIDVQKVNATKQKIIDLIKTSGPSFPTRISREAGISPLFIGALLSEMVSEKKLVMSRMKVGSSPLYFLQGQEATLEGFIQYLNSKEQEAVYRLRDAKVLDDSNQDPAMRIALRKVHDFAIPITVRSDNEEKLFWKFFTITDSEAKQHIEEALGLTKPKKEPIVEQIKEVKKQQVKEEPVIEAPVKASKEKPLKDRKPNAFSTDVKDFLSTKDIEVLEEIMFKPKEYHARIRLDTPFGKQELYLIAKEKKKIVEDDLALAVHKAQTERMPAYLLAKGDIDKTAKPYLDQWKNLLKFEKLK